jgi:hypothetical protein
LPAGPLATVTAVTPQRPAAAQVISLANTTSTNRVFSSAGIFNSWRSNHLANPFQPPPQ